MTENIWKLDWNPSGITETFVLDTHGKKSGDIISLKRTFFKKNISCVLSNNQILSVSEKNDSADIVLYNQELRLSNLVGEPIYQNIKIQNKAVNQNITITAVYVADHISSDSFGQELHPWANVTHYQTDSFITSSQNMYTDYLRIRDYIELPNGHISSHSTSFKSDEILFNSFSLTKRGIESSESTSGIFCKDSCIKYDQVSKNWVQYINSLREERPILSFQKREVPPGRILLTSQADSSTLETVDWLKINAEKKQLSVPLIETSNSKTENAIIDKLFIGNFLISVDAYGNLNINNSLVIEKNTGSIKLGTITLTKEKLMKLDALLS
jgi:hypothetical protein